MLKQFATLYRLAMRRQRSEADYRRFQAFQASLLTEHLEHCGVQVTGRSVLDLGSGIGGYGDEWARRRGRVMSVDLIAPTIKPAHEIRVMVGNALSIPLADETVDFVFCASLIEHVPNPKRLLAEIERVLAPGGFCYLSFPPFYSPRGGHEFAPYHYLGERLALRLVNAQQHKHADWAKELYHISTEPASYADTYPDWGLYRMTIAKARRLLRGTGLCVVNMSTRYLPFSLIRWPLIGEVLTWHAQFILRKPYEAVKATPELAS